MPKRVLVIDPVAVNRIRLSVLLEGAHYAVTCISDISEFSAGGEAFDLVLMGMSTDQAPTQFLNAIRCIARPGVPVLCLDADPTPLRRLLAIKSGVRDVLPCRSSDSLILARMRGLLREGEAQRECERRRMMAASFGLAEAADPFLQRATVACVGTDDGMTRLLQAGLGHDVQAMGLDDVIRDAPTRLPPELYLFRVTGDGQQLETLLPELRDRSHSRHAPVLVVHDAERPDVATRALALGASDIAADTSSGEELELRIDALLKQRRMKDMLRRSDENSHRLAATDHLTGLYNRRYAEAYLGDLVARASSTGAEFALMVIDLDHFKSVNDRFGHSVGDEVLTEIAHRLRDNLRACDLVSRHGGEEFLVVLPETGVEDARLTAERLRQAVSARPVRVQNGVEVDVTASVGVAVGQADTKLGRKNGTFDQPEGGFENSCAPLFEAADAALYRAKETGRNRVAFNAF